MRKIGAEGAKYPMTAPQYVDESTPQLGTLLEVMHAAGIASEAYATATIDRAFWELMIAAALLVVGLAIAIGSMLVVVDARHPPLTKLSIVVQRLADNDTAVEIPEMRRNDELGSMAAALSIFKANIIDAARLRGEQAENEQRQLQQRKADMVKLADNFESAVGEIIETVSASSSELEASAEYVEHDRDAFAGIDRQRRGGFGGSLRQRAVGGFGDRGDGRRRSVKSAARCRHRRGWPPRRSIRPARTNDRVSELSKAASRIGDVVELINTIAGQTNLLALNATIEAARAGEAGRGFAVVASEVKALAEQTAKATGEIGQQITGIQAATQELGRTRSRRSAAPSRSCRRSPRPSPRRSKSRARRRRKFPATCSRPPRAPSRFRQHHRRAAWRRRDRIGVDAGSLRGAIAVARQQPPQARGRQVPGFGARGLIKRRPGRRAARPLAPVGYAGDVKGLCAARAAFWPFFG